MTEVSREGRTYKDKGEAIETAPDRLAGTAVHCVISWKSLSLTFLALGIFAWCCHFLLIRLAPDMSESWQPFLSTALKAEAWHTLLSWQAFSHVIAVSWNRCCFSRFPLTPLSLAILVFGHLFFLRPSSVDILFSPHLILLTGFSLGTIFLFPVVSHYYFETKLFPLTPYVLTSPLSWVLFSFSHLFLLTFSYLANTIYPVDYRTCTKPFLYHKAFPKYFPVLLPTTKLARSTSQHDFVLPSLHKVLPSTTSYYKACTVLPSTTSYYKACTKYFPVLLHTTKLSQSTSQYYFLLQSLHKVLPSTASYCKACTKYFPVYNTSYCKACTKYFPVLLRTTKLLHTEALTQQSFYTQKLLHTEALHTEKLLRSKALTHRRFWHTHKLLDRVALSHRSFHTEKLLDTKAFAHASFYTE